MTDTSAASGLTVQQWDAKYYREYLSENRFKASMGTTSNSIIQVKEDLTKKSGDKITYALVNKLSGAGVTGSSTLEGNEESMDTRSHLVTVDKLRNAVRVSDMEEQKSAIPLRNAAREMLKDWSMENLRDAVISAMGSKNGTAYGSVSEANKDIWSVDNADRVLFGALKSNYNVDHSVALATIDTTADKFDAAALTLMKRIALTADPKIRPIRTTEDERWYIVYANSLSFRDLKADSVITAAQREAMARGKNNPLFAGGDIVYDGCIVKEIEDIPSVGAVGGSSSTVGSVYLCGAQAIGLAWAKRTTSKTEEFDYGDKHGVAIEEIRAVEKLTFGSGSSDTADLKDHGMVTGYFSATADA